jgi:hypothetical protein
MSERRQHDLVLQTAAAVVAGAEESVNHARELRALIESERAERRLREEDRRARIGLTAR